MLTFRPGGYKWFLIIEKIKKQEQERIQRQKIIEGLEKNRIKNVSVFPQSIRHNN